MRHWQSLQRIKRNNQQTLLHVLAVRVALARECAARLLSRHGRSTRLPMGIERPQLITPSPLIHGAKKYEKVLIRGRAFRRQGRAGVHHRPRRPARLGP